MLNRQLDSEAKGDDAKSDSDRTEPVGRFVDEGFVGGKGWAIVHLAAVNFVASTHLIASGSPSSYSRGHTIPDTGASPRCPTKSRSVW